MKHQTKWLAALVALFVFGTAIGQDKNSDNYGREKFVLYNVYDFVVSGVKLGMTREDAIAGLMDFYKVPESEIKITTGGRQLEVAPWGREKGQLTTVRLTDKFLVYAVVLQFANQKPTIEQQTRWLKMITAKYGAPTMARTSEGGSPTADWCMYVRQDPYSANCYSEPGGNFRRQPKLTFLGWFLELSTHI